MAHSAPTIRRFESGIFFEALNALVATVLCIWFIRSLPFLVLDSVVKPKDFPELEAPRNDAHLQSQ